MASNARWATRRALQEALTTAEELTGIAISRGWMGEAQEREALWLGSTVGSLNVPVFTGPDTVANPITYDDVFTIPVHIVAGAAGQTLDAAEDRCEVLYRALERVVRTAPQLGQVDGLAHVTLTEIVLESFSTKEGFASFADVTLTCKSRISGGAQ